MSDQVLPIGVNPVGPDDVPHFSIAGRWEPNWLLLLSAFVGAFAVAAAWYLLTRLSIVAAVVWPLNALCVGACVRLSKGRASTIGLVAAFAVGNMAANFMMMGPAPAPLLYPLYAVVEITLVLAAIRKLAPHGVTRLRPREAGLLALAVAAAAPAASACLAALGQMLHYGGARDTLITFLFWWTCNSLGMMIILPLLLGSTRAALARFTTRRTRYEALAAAAATIATAFLVFSFRNSAWAVLIAPALVFATFRFGLLGAAVAMLLTTIVAIAATSAHHGPIAYLGGSALLRMAALLQLFLASCWLVTLPPAFLLESFAAELKTKEDRLVESQMLAADAQNRMLRYQLDPHFFFNTLTALSSLIQEGDAARADRMVVSLSRFLRHSLQQSPTEKISLAEEIGAQKRYLEIEQIRFGKRLRWAIRISPEAASTPVPCFILQPLVENAVKHAVATTTGPVRLEISALISGGMLTVSMSDDGRAQRASTAKLGVGLENVRRRLRLLYGPGASLSVSRRSPHGFVATIAIPVEGGELSG